jgi:hypothetical protein
VIPAELRVGGLTLRQLPRPYTRLVYLQVLFGLEVQLMPPASPERSEQRPVRVAQSPCRVGDARGVAGS